LLQRPRARKGNAENGIAEPGGELAIRLRWSDFKLYIHNSNAPEVIQQPKEIARDHGAGHPDVEPIASCSECIEVYAGLDVNKDYFNEFVYVPQILENVPGVILFDPEAEYFI
jgi:hypothetical protein